MQSVAWAMLKKMALVSILLWCGVIGVATMKLMVLLVK